MTPAGGDDGREREAQLRAENRRLVDEIAAHTTEIEGLRRELATRIGAAHDELIAMQGKARHYARTAFALGIGIGAAAATLVIVLVWFLGGR